MRGRRKPIEAKVLDGTYRKDRDGPLSPADLPEPPPPPPAGLPADVAVKWAAAAGVLAGVVKRRDVLMLVEMARWLARSERVAGQLDAMEPGAKGFNQLLIAAGISTDKLLQLSGRFGLTPADRAKLRSEAAGPAPARVLTRPQTALDRKGKPRGVG